MGRESFVFFYCTKIIRPPDSVSWPLPLYRGKTDQENFYRTAAKTHGKTIKLVNF